MNVQVWTYIIVGITFAAILVSSSEDSKFYYIDNISFNFINHNWL